MNENYAGRKKLFGKFSKRNAPVLVEGFDTLWVGKLACIANNE
jgi:hypothetical protein